MGSAAIAAMPKFVQGWDPTSVTLQSDLNFRGKGPAIVCDSIYKGLGSWQLSKGREQANGRNDDGRECEHHSGDAETAGLRNLA